MKILSILSTYAPHLIGGAEISAMNAMHWLHAQGHDVAVVTTAQEGEVELLGDFIDGIRIWRFRWPRSHTLLRHATAKPLQKLIWHLQDLFDHRNRNLLARVLDAYRPDIVLIRVIRGIGYNALYEVAVRDIPAVYFMHDLNLVCAKSDMFRSGKSCQRQCLSCRVVSKLRFAPVRRIPRVSFCSPSRAILDIASKYLPLSDFYTATIMNPNKYAKPTVKRQISECPRFLYVGRLHDSKGVDVLLEAASLLSINRRFTVTIVGSGPNEINLKARFGDQPWCCFVGQVPHEEVANYMANSDVLCIPSIWLENSPGVAIHALGIALPVIGSNNGGIPEYIVNEKNGLLVEPGSIKSWRDALLRVLDDCAAVERWHKYALDHVDDYDHDRIGRELLDYIYKVAADNKSALSESSYGQINDKGK